MLQQRFHAKWTTIWPRCRRPQGEIQIKPQLHRHHVQHQLNLNSTTVFANVTPHLQLIASYFDSTRFEFGASLLVRARKYELKEKAWRILINQRDIPTEMVSASPVIHSPLSSIILFYLYPHLPPSSFLLNLWNFDGPFKLTRTGAWEGEKARECNLEDLRDVSNQSLKKSWKWRLKHTEMRFCLENEAETKW